MNRAHACLCLCLVLAGCRKQATTSPDAQPPDPEQQAEVAITPAEPANRAAGDEIDATIPLVGGDAIELASLRGRPVLLEISASWEPGFAEAHALYLELLAEHPQLAVVVVVADPEAAALDGLPEPLALAWDPAGALAAKLECAILPTMFVIDPSGHVGAVINGWSDEVATTLRSAVAAAAGSD
jgi:hypothetical protein